MRQISFGFIGAESDGGKGRFNGVSGPEMFPVFGGKIVEGEKRRSYIYIYIGAWHQVIKLFTDLDIIVVPSTGKVHFQECLRLLSTFRYTSPLVPLEYRVVHIWCSSTEAGFQLLYPA